MREIIAIMYVIVCIVWGFHKALETGPDAPMDYVFYIVAFNMIFFPVIVIKSMYGLFLIMYMLYLIAYLIITIPIKYLWRLVSPDRVVHGSILGT